MQASSEGNEVSEDATAIVVRFEEDSMDVEEVCEVLLALNSLVKAIAKEIDPEATGPEVKLKWTATSKKGEGDDG